MTKIKKILLCLLLLQNFLSFTPAFAQTSGASTLPVYNPGVDTQIGKYLCTPDISLFTCINQLYKFAIVLAAVVGVFFLVIAGYLYMSSGGSDESVTKAKDILTSTIASLVILMAGYILLKAINPDLIAFQTISPPGVTLPADAGLVSGGGTTGGTSGGTIGGTGGPITGTSQQCFIIAGNYNIGPYATDPNHEQLVLQIYNSLQSQDFSSAASIDSYIKSKYPTSPLTGDMVFSAANSYGVDAKLMVAIMRQDSSLGTAGLGVSTLNPGNVGNNDSGAKNTFDSWQSGVNAVAQWLAAHKASSC